MSTTRHLFHIPQNETTGGELRYFCGHSLGLQPKSARDHVLKEMEVWKDHAVEGHFKEGSHWYSYHETVTDSLARLAGAKPSEVVAMNSLTANLHLMMASFLRPQGNKSKILTDAPCFPSDKYALDSALKFHGLDPAEALIKFETLQGNTLATTEDWVEKIEAHAHELCLVYVNPVNYLTGQFLDMKVISETCQRLGLPLGLDLAHSMGNVELELHDWGVDFAIWCSYKYLNSSPGAIGGAYVHERHHTADLPRLEGWWGTNPHTRFQMGDRFESANTAEAWQLSNPPILMLAALRASLDIFDQTSMAELAKSGKAMTDKFVGQVESSNLGEKIHIVNGHVRRGNMLCLRLKDAGNFEKIQETLLAEGVILDTRKPDILRLSFCSLYTNEEDIQALLDVLESVLVRDQKAA